MAEGGWRTARGQRERMERAALSSSASVGSPVGDVPVFVNAMPRNGDPSFPASCLDINFIRVFARRSGVDSMRKEVTWFQFAIRAGDKYQWVVEKRYSDCLQLQQQIAPLSLDGTVATLAPFPAKAGMFGLRGDTHLAQRQEGLDAYFTSLIALLQQLASTAIFEQGGADTPTHAPRVAFSILINFLTTTSTSCSVDVPRGIDKFAPIDFTTAIADNPEAATGGTAAQIAGTPPPHAILTSDSTFIVVLMIAGIDPSDLVTRDGRGSITITGKWPSLEALLADAEPNSTIAPATQQHSTIPSGAFELTIPTPIWASPDDYSLVSFNGCLQYKWEK